MPREMMREQVELKSPDEIARVREASLIVHDVLQEVIAAIAPGVSTLELDVIAERGAAARGAQPAFKGYHGYPAVICISVNDEVVHGIPSAKRLLKRGDIVGLDFGVAYKGFYGDSAYTVPVGEPSPEARLRSPGPSGRRTRGCCSRPRERRSPGPSRPRRPMPG